MAVGLATKSHQAVDEEARAEVDVLNSRLDKTAQLTKKIQASLGRLETTSQNVQDVAGPLNGEARRLQVLGHSKYSSFGSKMLSNIMLKILTPSCPLSIACDILPTAKMTKSKSFDQVLIYRDYPHIWHQ